VVFVIFVAFVTSRRPVSVVTAYFLSRTSTPETGPRHVVPE
jgi:hypothetical protein